MYKNSLPSGNENEFNIEANNVENIYYPKKCQ